MFVPVVGADWWVLSSAAMGMFGGLGVGVY